MKKIKKLTLILGVALTLLTPVLGLIPPTQGNAYAVSNGEVSIGDQVKSYIYYRAIAHCILVSELADKQESAWEHGTRVDENHVSSFEWFSGGWGDPDYSTWVGYLDDDDGNGKSSCHSASMLQDAYSIWQLGGSSDGITALCYSGFQREGEEFENDTPKECIQGTSEQFVRPNKDKSKAAQTFLANVTEQFYGGKEPELTNAMRWYLAYHSVQGLCGATKRDNPEEYSESKVSDDDRLVYMIGPDGTKEVWALGSGYTEGKDVTIGTNSSMSDSSKKSCGDLAKDAANSTYAGSYRDWVDEHPELASQDNDILGNSKEIDVKCADEWSLGSLTNPLDWLSCNVLKGMVSASKAFDNTIAGMLCVDETSIFPGSEATCNGIGSTAEGSAEAFHRAWNVFRILALGLLAIGGLVMVISQGLGFEIFDAYTVKKTMPRLIVAAIGISLSWQLLNFLVTLSNGLGIGVRSLIYSPFTTSGVSIDPNILGGGELAITALFAGGAFVALGAIGLMSFIGTALLAILIAFIVLIIRNMLVILLILVAPIAIAAYILPNTEKYYKTWWDWLLKALLVFPIITAFIAIGHVLAAITSTNGNTIASFVAFGAYFAPYFLIPAAFRFAGGLMATLGGFANDRSRGGFDRLKKFRQGQQVRNWENIQAGKRWQGNPVGERLSRTLQTGSLLGQAGYNPARMRDRVRSARSTRISANGAEAEKSAAVRAVLGNDDLLTASLHGRGTEADARTYLQSLGQRGAALEQNVASIRQARRDMGRQAFEDFAAANLAGTGTGYAGGPAEMFETINRVAGNDRARATRILNSARGQADRAKRIDLSGAGFGTSADQLEWMNNHAPSSAAQRNAQHAAVNEVMTDEALNAKSAYEIGTARNGGLVNMAGAVQRRVARAESALNAAQVSGNAAAITTAEHEYKRILAATAGLHDVASNSSPENAQITGALLGQATSVGGKQGTVLQAIDRYRSDNVFQQYRREYGNAAAAAAAGSLGGVGGGAPGGGPGGPGGGAPGGAPGGGGAPPSDRRLKKNITYLETLDNGIRLYSFQYIWGGAIYVGVMAQDLLDTHPEAVTVGSDGFYRVSYDVLGIEMTELEQWLDRTSVSLR